MSQRHPKTSAFEHLVTLLGPNGGNAGQVAKLVIAAGVTCPVWIRAINPHLSGKAEAELVLAVVGAFLLFLGLIEIGEFRAVIHRGKRVTGTVIHLETGSSSMSLPSGGGTAPASVTLYYPVVRFATEDGQTVQFRSTFGSDPCPYPVGATVPVAYQPADPGNAVIASRIATYILPIGAAALGVAALAALAVVALTIR